MNFLSLISPWLDINCQNNESATVVKPKNFHKLNTPLIMDKLGLKDSSRHLQLNYVISYFFNCI